MSSTTTPMTNEGFADAVGCTFTMASRLRNGRRLPSARLLVCIRDAFGLPYDDLMGAYKAGPEAFSAYLRVNVFHDPA